MFLVRSAFWLGLVFSAMPFERNEIARAIDQAQGGLAAEAVATAKEECANKVAACDALGALLIKASQTDAPSAQDRAALERLIAADDGAGNKAPRPSANSLTAQDRAAPWRGHRTKSGA